MYRKQIIKKEKKRKRKKKQFFKNLRKQFLDIHIRNVMPKYESSKLNNIVDVLAL